MDPLDKTQIPNNSLINQPYTLNSNKPVTGQNFNPTINMNQPSQNINNFSNYYNPIAIQNYYSMLSSRGIQNQMPMQMPMNNYYSTPYNMNKAQNPPSEANTTISNNPTNTINTNQNIMNNPYYNNFYQNNFNRANMPNNQNPNQNPNHNPNQSHNQYNLKGTQMQNNFIQNLNYINYQQQYLQMQKVNNPQYSQNINPQVYNKAYENRSNNFGNNNYNNNRENYNSKPKTPLNQTPKKEEDPMEMEKWIERRKKNFPSESNVQDKIEFGKKKDDAGMISKLELKLREKIKLISSINRKGFMKKRPNRQRRKKRNKFKSKSQKPNEVEEGEIVEEIKEENEGEQTKPVAFTKRFERKQDSNDVKASSNINREKPMIRLGFRYKRNKMYDDMIKSDKLKELNIILQAFRYFVNEKLI